MPHLNYGLLLWGVNLKDIFLLQKKAIRLVTHNTYNSHTEPIFKGKWIIKSCRYVSFEQIKIPTQIIS